MINTFSTVNGLISNVDLVKQKYTFQSQSNGGVSLTVEQAF